MVTIGSKSSRQGLQGLYRVLLSVILLTFVSCSGGGSGASSSGGVAPGAVAFSVNWADSEGSAGKAPSPAASKVEVFKKLDCQGAQVSTVEAKVYDGNGNLLATGGPWDCELHSGVVEGVPPGTDRHIVILGMRGNTHVYRGESTTPIVVKSGSKTDVGTIDAFAFDAPGLLSPSAGAYFTAPELEKQSADHTATFECESVADIHGDAYYMIQIAASPGFSPLRSEQENFNKTTFSPPSGLTDGTYYWRVRVLDLFRNEGPWSEIRSFVVSTPTSLSLAAALTEIPADGTTQSTLSALVKDAAANNAPNGTTVTFTTTAGTLSAGTAATTNGVATVQLTSGTSPGTATLTATIGGVSSTATVTFQPLAPSTLSLTALPDAIPADGTTQSTLTALVKDALGNTVPDGTAVAFTTAAGTLSASKATTANGVATVQLTSGTSPGTASLTATAGNASNTTTVSFQVLPPATLSLTALPTTIPADGDTQSTLSALVKDALGNNVPNGTTVAFSTSAGTLSASTATTTNGVATARLRSATVPGTATLTATAGSASNTVALTFQPLPPATLSLTAVPAAIPADGATRSTLTALVKDGLGNTVPNGTTVAFSTTAGTLSASTAATTNGVATVQLTSIITPGTATLTATAGSASNTVAVIFQPLPPATLSLTADPAAIPADGSTQSTLTALVKDALGNNVPNGTTVAFSTTAGTLSASTATTTDGVAAVQLTSTTTPGTATLTATAGSASNTATVTFEALPPATLTLTALPATIPADGSTQSTLSALVKDALGNNVPNGTTVVFLTTAGTLSASTGTTTNGVATVGLTSATTPGTATLTATAGNASNTTTVSFQALPPATLTLTALPTTIPADGTTQSSLSALVKDALGNNVPNGTTVAFSTTAGTLSASTGTTTNGIATVGLTSATTPGTATLTATAGNASNTGTVTFQALPPATLTLTALPTTIPADGDTQSTLTALVKDALGNNVPNGTTVAFSTTAGTLSASTGTTTNGIATVGLTSATTPGTATLTATAGNASNTTTVSFQALPPATMTLTALPATIPADGSTQSTLSALAKDALGNTVPNGTTVVFSTTAGTLSASAATTTNGVATVGLTSATAPGTATITATAGNASNNVKVTFQALAPSTLSLTANPPAILADGDTQSTLTAVVKDALGNNVPNGTTVAFSTTAGTLSASTGTTTNGVAAVQLRSTNPGTATVNAVAGTASGNATVTFQQAISFFPDSNLEAAVRVEIGKPVGPITLTDLEGITFLNASSSEISDIEGLQYCSNINQLDLSNNQISDISPLADLTNLFELHLSNNQISDISPLADLTNLNDLSLDDNQISDISPLEGLPNLSILSLPGNLIVNIQALVLNAGIGSGDSVNLINNPLDSTACFEQIPVLQGRGVIVNNDCSS